MPNSDRPRSPFAGMVDFSIRPDIRALSPGEVEQRLAAHRLYLQTDRRQGRRANFSSTDLSGLDFFGATFSQLQIGGGGNQVYGTMVLAKTNVINPTASTRSFDIGDSGSNNGGSGTLLFGITN